MEETSEIAYTVEMPRSMSPLEVRRSANAWWMNRAKIEALLAAFRLDATIAEACAHAGISLRQYKYFQSVHPEFVEIREMYRAEPMFKARLTIMKNIGSDYGAAMKYLEKRLPEEFGSPSRRRGNRKEETTEVNEDLVREVASILRERTVKTSGKRTAL